MKQIRKRLTYANVMSSLAVFLVLGGAAFAATKLPKNSVGTKQLKNNAVTAAKIKNEAVSGAKIKAGAVDGTKLVDGSVTNGKLADGSVSTGKLADGSVSTGKLADGSVSTGKLADGSVSNGKLGADAVTGEKVKDGSITGSDVNQSTLNGVKAANVYATGFDVGPNTLVNPSDPGIKAGGCFLVCSVEFPRDVSSCSATASSSGPAGGTGEPAMAEVFPSSSKNALLVVMWDDEGHITGHDFALTVVCPTTS